MSKIRLHIDTAQYDRGELQTLAEDVCSLATNLNLVVVFDYNHSIHSVLPEEPVNDIIDKLRRS